MAKRKPSPLDAPTPDPMKAVIVYVPQQLHIRLKTAAMHEGRPMSKLVTEAIKTYLRTNGR